jgi:hypothetical protein
MPHLRQKERRMQKSPFTPEQIAARELVWRHSQEGEPLYLGKDQVAALWRSIADTGAELARLRDEVVSYRNADPKIRTEAVELALHITRTTGKSSVRNEDGTPSKTAHIAGYACNRGAEAVQQEIDRFIELTY